MGLYKNNSGTLAPIAGTPTNVISGLQNGIDQIANSTTKNLLPNKASSYHTNPRTINGVTFTINDDGSVTTSGTNTGGGDINYAINGDILFLNDCGPYILSGFPSGLSDNSYLGIYNPNIAWYASSKSNPEVTVDATLETGSYVCILLRSTYTGTYTWKPMIRPVGVDDNTYQPYAMTNRELTEKLTIHTVLTNSVSDVTVNTTSSKVCPVTLTPGLWNVNIVVQGKAAITSNAMRCECKLGSHANSSLPHNTPYATITISDVMEVTTDTVVGLDTYFDTAYELYAVKTKAIKIS